MEEKQKEKLKKKEEELAAHRLLMQKLERESHASNQTSWHPSSVAFLMEEKKNRNETAETLCG